MQLGMRVYLIIYILFVLFKGSTAQVLEDSNYVQLHMLRIDQQNDLYQYWYQSDENFSDGLHIELAHRVFNNKPADWFLIGFKDTPYNDFSLAITQDIFTPANLKATEVDSSDRPYSGLLYFTYTKYSNQFYKGRKLITKFYLGIEGEDALGEEVQNGVHEIIDVGKAKGWDNQLGTGLMLDYEVTYSQLLPLGNHFYESNAYGQTHVGTIYNYVKAGFNFKIGHYSDTYMNYSGIYDYQNKAHITEEQFSQLNKVKRRLIPKSVKQLPVREQVRYINKRMNRKVQCYLIFDFHAIYTFQDGTRSGSLVQLSENTYEKPLEEENRLIVQGFYSLNAQYGRIILRFNRFLENDLFAKGNVFGFGEVSLSLVL